MHPELSELQKAYEKGDLVLFVGAGVPAAAGLPSWARLVEFMMDHARAKGVSAEILEEVKELAAARKFIDAFSAIKDALGGPEFCHFVEQQLDDKDHPVPLVAETITELSGLRAILTTNIDHILERALKGKWPTLSRATSDIAQRSGFLLKLHGTLLDRATWVFTRADYDRAMYANPKLETAFSALFHGRTLLFVGYGLADDDFDRLLARVRAFAGDQPPRHFAMVPAGAVRPHRRKMLGESGLSLVTYANESGDHREIIEMLRALSGGEATAPAQSVSSSPLARPTLSGISGAAQRIIDDRGESWGARLLSQALADELRAAELLRRDLSLDVAFGASIERKQPKDALDWTLAQLDQMRRIYSGLGRLINEGLGDAFGSDAEPSDPAKVVYVAGRIGQGYREIITWTMKWKHLYADDMFEHVLELGPMAGEHLLHTIEEWVTRMQRTIGNCLREPPAPGTVISIGINFSLPNGWQTSMESEVRTIANRIALEHRLETLYSQRR